jgi:predicted nucleotidyltransferase
MIKEYFPLTQLKMEIICELYRKNFSLSELSKQMNKSSQLLFKTLKKMTNIVNKENNTYFLKENFLKIFEKVIKKYFLEYRLGGNILIIEAVKKYYKPKEMYLFGSYVKGTYNKKSDIDIYVISDVENEKEIFKKINNSFKIKIQIVCVSSQIHLSQKDNFSNLYLSMYNNKQEAIKIDLD